jgi:pyridoxal phosphate enzyme (YggS family)
MVAITTPAQLRDAYRRINDTIARAAEVADRRADHIVLVAVTKTATPDQIRQLVEMGHRDLGENRVQQLIQRAAQLDEFLGRKRMLGGRESAPAAGRPGASGPSGASPVRWHMIGHLQRNKARLVVPVVKLIHSVDTLRLAEELHEIGGKLPVAGRRSPQAEPEPIEVLLQVNISGEESKSGVAVPAAIHVAEQIDTMVNLKLRGLMTMAPYSDNPEDARPVFARCRELFEEMKAARIGGREFNVLSMGMSGDYRVAIEEGANVVRIGRALFGEGEETD